MSETQRKRMNRRLWSKVREIIGSTDDITMREDPLGARYSVNKYAIIVESDDYSMILDTHARLLALLMVEGWQVANGTASHNVTHGDYEANAVVSRPHPAQPGCEARFDIGVYA